MEAAGFVGVSVVPTYFDDAMIEEALGSIGERAGLRSYPREMISKSVFSARITARKP